jgi:hypothetical protein
LTNDRRGGALVAAYYAGRPWSDEELADAVVGFIVETEEHIPRRSALAVLTLLGSSATARLRLAEAKPVEEPELEPTAD